MYPYRHWVEKNCVPWATNYFSENLPKIEILNDDYKITIKDLRSLTGDCDVTQRKGKVKCLFELKIEFNITITKNGDNEKEEEITIVLPEFEHDYDEDDFNFDIRTSNIPYKSIVRKNVLPEITQNVFLKFQPALLAAHEPQLKHNTD